MKPAPAVRDALVGDRAAVVATLARAFWADPFIVHFYPDERTRGRRVGRFFDLVWRANFGFGRIDVASMCEAAALWRPPGRWRVPRRTMLAHLPGMLTAYGAAAGRVLATLACMEHHHPAGPHWYLMTLGTDPAAQGCGVGGAVT